MNSEFDPKRIEYLFNDLQKKFKGKNKKEQIIKYIDDKNFYAKESPLFKGYIIGPVSEEEREELKKLVDMTELERRRYLNICNMEVRDKNIGEKYPNGQYKNYSENAKKMKSIIEKNYKDKKERTIFGIYNRQKLMQRDIKHFGTSNIGLINNRKVNFCKEIIEFIDSKKREIRYLRDQIEKILNSQYGDLKIDDYKEIISINDSKYAGINDTYNNISKEYKNMLSKLKKIKEEI